MAYKRNYKRTKSTYKTRQASAKNLNKFAYQLGRVQSGLGKNTQVNDSFERGFNMKNNTKARKPLY